MKKPKNPKTCKIAVGDEVEFAYKKGRRATVIGYDPDRTWGRWEIRVEGSKYTDCCHRTHLTYLGPREPEPYEAWFA